MSDFLNAAPELLWIVLYSIRFDEKINSIFELQQPGIVSLGRKIQCPYVQEHRAKKRGPASQTEINLGKFREGKENLEMFSVDKIYLGKFREDIDTFR